MRGLKIIVCACSVLLMLSGCAKPKNNVYTIDDPSSPQITQVQAEAGEGTALKPTPAASSGQDDQTSPANEPPETQAPQATESEATAVSQGEVQANDQLVDALIKELDDMGSLLDSLDDVQDSDLIVPAS